MTNATSNRKSNFCAGSLGPDWSPNLCRGSGATTPGAFPSITPYVIEELTVDEQIDMWLSLVPGCTPRELIEIEATIADLHISREVSHAN